MSEAAIAVTRILTAIGQECERQEVLWGEQNHPDFYARGNTNGASTDAQHEYHRKQAEMWKEINAWRAQTSAVDGRSRDTASAWDGIALEELHEALAETDPEKMRVELIQTAAVIVSWIAALDRRAR
jgi:hypothetical protein